MDAYTKTIYPDVENDYPSKLCKYIADRFFSSATENSKLLDVGCSKGTHMKLFEKYSGAEAYGLDIRAEPGLKNVSECNLEKDKFPFPDNHFDFAWSKSVVEHVHNPGHLVEETYRVLKPGGVAVIMTPDWESQMSHFWDDFTHVQPWTRKSLMNCLKIKGFVMADCEKFYQLPFTWKYPCLKIIPKIISICPQSLKWKDSTMTNGKDRKLIRFSKELMLLGYGQKKK